MSNSLPVEGIMIRFIPDANLHRTVAPIVCPKCNQVNTADVFMGLHFTQDKVALRCPRKSCEHTWAVAADAIIEEQS